MIIALALGAAIGLVFASKDNAYLVWVDLLGDLYIQLITLLVAPVILLSILSGFIRLGSGKRMKRIGAQSVFWMLLQSALAVLLSLIVGLGLNRAARHPPSSRRSTRWRRARSLPTRGRRAR